MLINNRQNGRRRGRGGPQVRNGAGGGADRGNRIDNRARGNAAQLHEKYRNLARDAQTQGDRVMTEYYLQFADHYFRVLSESRARFEENQPRRARDDEYDDGGDDGEVYADDRVGQPQRAERQEPRYERQDRYEQRGGEQQPQRRPDRDEAAPRPAPPPPPAGNDAGPSFAEGGEAERPRRGRRPRRDDDGAQPERVDADRLTPPAFLTEGAAPAAEAPVTTDDEEPPRRRRTRRPKADGDSVAA